MKMRRLIGLFVAAAFAAGSTAVHAIKLVDSAGTDPASTTGSMASVTYAKETLLTSATVTPADSSDSANYYTIARDHFVSGPADLVATSNTTGYFVSYVLDGMVFVTSPTITLYVVDTDDKKGNITYKQGTTGTLDKIAGGVSGAKTAAYQLMANQVVGSADLIELTARFAIQGEGSGSITRTVTNRDLAVAPIPGITSSMTHSLPGAVIAVPALRDIITPGETPKAMSAYEFMAFDPSTAVSKILTATLGTIHLTVQGKSGLAGDTTNYRHASPIKEAKGMDLVVDTLAEIAGSENNSVAIAGDFSFVKKLALTPTLNSCNATAGSELRKLSKDDPNVLTNDVKSQKASVFSSSQSLCLTVDGETPIPVTDPYTVTTKYKGITNAAFPPVGGPYDLAGIARDGTSYHIPYLTTYEGYNQRFSIVNRRSGPVAYNFGEFRSEDGVTTTPGMKASGMLPPGQTVLTTSDIVEITGGSRASATLSIVAPDSSISAAVQQVNRMTRTVDTVYLVHGR